MRGRFNLTTAAWTTLTAVVLGCMLFQASSLSFDYMKLRQLPIYATAGSIGEFNGTVESITDEMRERRKLIRGLLRDRSTIDLDISTSTERARASVVDARVAIRQQLGPEQLTAIGWDKAAVNFTDTDKMFQALCSSDQNATASLESSGLADASSEPQISAPGSRVQLREDQKAALAKACAIPDNYCVDDQPAPNAGARARMICAQTSLQAIKSRAAALGAFNFDGAGYLTSALKLTYPSIATEDANQALQVAEAYRSLTRDSSAKDCGELTDRNEEACASSVRPRLWFAVFWDFLFSLPLAIMYLKLAFIFGGLGSLSNYLFATFAPNNVAKTPDESPWYAIVTGGGSAILILLIVMAGFQFLAVGASTPDLAYPNPLTVCGLSVLVGLRGDAILAALKEWVGKFFASKSGEAADQARPDQPEPLALAAVGNAPPPQAPPAAAAATGGPTPPADPAAPTGEDDLDHADEAEGSPALPPSEPSSGGDLDHVRGG